MPPFTVFSDTTHDEPLGSFTAAIPAIGETVLLNDQRWRVVDVRHDLENEHVYVLVCPIASTPTDQPEPGNSL